MKSIFDLAGQGRSQRQIARTLGISRNTVRKYVQSPQIPRPRPRPRRPSRLDECKDHINRRLSEGVDNCVVLLRELKAQGYTGGYTILKDYVKPFRQRHQTVATQRFETEPGQQAQVDFGRFKYVTASGGTRYVWAFVMVLSWSRAMYVEFVDRADTATFIRCHINAFEHFGGMVHQCLYDNAKVVVLERDGHGQPVYNDRFLDFSLRLGFRIRLCQPRRPQTKGRVESGIKYVKHNFWPTAQFADLGDLNAQVRQWVVTVADQRIHGTTRQQPADLLCQERAQLTPAVERVRLAVYTREQRKVGRDGYVQWQGGSYGVPVVYAGCTVQVEDDRGLVTVWDHEHRLAVHPKASRPGQRFTLPGQWTALTAKTQPPRRTALGRQLPAVEVERRALTAYEVLAGVVGPS